MCTIIYRSEQAFYDGVMELLKRGICYTANHDALIITLTGGY